MLPKTAADYAKTIDHTLLKPTATPNEIRSLCEDAVRHGFFSVCVNPAYVPLCRSILEQEETALCTVVGFPFGATSPRNKAQETAWAVEHGANEIDMVINLGWAKAGDWRAVQIDINEVVRAAEGALVKVIIENCYLTDAEKAAACSASQDAGAQFVKTSTGFGTGGAVIEDVALMRRTVGDALGVKASGGIRSLETMQAMLEAGANRIGASSGVAILGEINQSAQ
ncbi:deoxyribose-phosphate aldolase [Acanthopleuribacter pedis]|uniref:Deoxyribose-phosphate aldolase n=1 Tax=Acanthopleuribacter pedis TaxID=442870 RepID=A0A8J7Q596_9BACT|nr:deoxyribose-phosphate aldolase [Acanthopleuribacter pedis]MBO1318372.1 deoxyribose-phosphate aldolase [Acanthopleuribacter pedis]